MATPNGLNDFQSTIQEATQRYIDGMTVLWDKFIEEVGSAHSAFFYGEIKEIGDEKAVRMRSER